MSRCDLHSWPLALELLQHFECHVFKLCTKFEWNWIVLMGAWSQLHQTWRGHRTIMTTEEICFRVRISCCIFKRGGSKLIDVKNDANFRTFWPPPGEIILVVGEISRSYTNCWSFTYDGTWGIHLMAIHCAAAALIKIEKERKGTNFVMRSMQYEQRRVLQSLINQVLIGDTK